MFILNHDLFFLSGIYFWMICLILSFYFKLCLSLHCHRKSFPWNSSLWTTGCSKFGVIWKICILYISKWYSIADRPVQYIQWTYVKRNIREPKWLLVLFTELKLVDQCRIDWKNRSIWWWNGLSSSVFMG